MLPFLWSETYVLSPPQKKTGKTKEHAVSASRPDGLTAAYFVDPRFAWSLPTAVPTGPSPFRFMKQGQPAQIISDHCIANTNPPSRPSHSAIFTHGNRQPKFQSARSQKSASVRVSAPHLLPGLLELVLHVDVRRGDEGVDAGEPRRRNCPGADLTMRTEKNGETLGERRRIKASSALRAQQKFDLTVRNSGGASMT